MKPTSDILNRYADKKIWQGFVGEEEYVENERKIRKNSKRRGAEKL
jgi:hypothetical protein